MTITKIVGTDDADAQAAIAELIAIMQRGGEYSEDLLDRLPQGRVEVMCGAMAMPATSP